MSGVCIIANDQFDVKTLTSLRTYEGEYIAFTIRSLGDSQIDRRNVQKFVEGFKSLEIQDKEIFIYFVKMNPSHDARLVPTTAIEMEMQLSLFSAFCALQRRAVNRVILDNFPPRQIMEENLQESCISFPPNPNKHSESTLHQLHLMVNMTRAEVKEPMMRTKKDDRGGIIYGLSKETKSNSHDGLPYDRQERTPPRVKKRADSEGSPIKYSLKGSPEEKRKSRNTRKAEVSSS